MLVVNDVWKRRQRLEHVEVLDKTFDEFMPPDYAAALTARDEEVTEHGRTIDRELVLMVHDQEFVIHHVKFPLVDVHGKNIGIGAVTTDVTERHQAEKQLHQAAKMEAIGQRTDGLAHDFNNLLAIVIGNAELGVEDDIKVRELAATLLEGLGYEIVTAADARAARECLPREERIDLVLSDVVLPGSVSGTAAFGSESHLYVRVLGGSGGSKRFSRLRQCITQQAL